MNSTATEANFTAITVNFPQPKWEWDVFGDGYTMVVTTPNDTSLRVRFLSWLILGSKWQKLP